MPITLNLYSEPYGTTGNIGENFLRLLGTPVADPLHTVVREAVQNIADAAKLGRGPEILIRLRTLAESETACLREKVLSEIPDEPGSAERFRNFLRRDKQVVLEICDFGTTGLGGPTRADRIPIGNTRTDFINFLRNIGTPRDTEHGGGTYGFGKASLYAVSGCQTILVDTLVGYAEEHERRLIGCHIGARHQVPEDGFMKQYTGRYWWGVAGSDGVADPALNEEAKELAQALGLPARSSERSGTTIMILDFNTEGEDLRTAGNRIVENLLYSFWPRMMEDAPAEKRFRCRVEVDGEALEIPRPEDFPPLHLFCRAMRKARLREGDGVEAISSEKPAKKLGWLAFEKGLRVSRRPIVENDSLFSDTSRHIALMRPVQLVVKYLEGTALPDPEIEWAGVFVASDEDEIERAFAQSEPPAHDDWIPGNLEKGHAKTMVRVAMRKLVEQALEFGLPKSSRIAHSGDAPPLARVSGILGAALEGANGEGAGEPRREGRKGGGGGGSRIARAARPTFVRLENLDGTKVAVFATRVQQDAQRSGRNLRATAAVALDGSANRQLDPSISVPTILEIRAVGDGDPAKGDSISLEGRDGDYEILVTVPDDCAVTLEVEVVGGGEG